MAAATPDPGRDFLSRGRRSLTTCNASGVGAFGSAGRRGAATVTFGRRFAAARRHVAERPAAGKADSAASDADRGPTSRRAPEGGGGCSAWALVHARSTTFTGEILAGVAMVVDAPRLIRWAREQMHDPAARERWASAAQALVLVFGGAAAAEAALRWVIARTRPKFPVRRRDTRAIKALFCAARFILDLAPILVFAAIVYGAVAMALDPLTPTGITMSVLAVATIEARLILCVARAVLIPPDEGTSFLRLDAETAIISTSGSNASRFGASTAMRCLKPRGGSAFRARFTPCC